jgi:hypothetical protein
MLTRPQQILLKRAQREAALPNDEYRDALELVSHCRSSKDPAMTDRDLDLLLGYFEAIFYRKVAAGELQPSCKPGAVFRQRGYWAAKNTSQETSRDRFTHLNLGQAIADLERKLEALGFGKSYCDSIRKNSTHGRNDAHALHIYRAALQRTLNAKARHAEAVANPY